MNKDLRYADSMIPVLTDNGFAASMLAEERALKSAIINNYLESMSELKQLVSVSERIIDTNNVNLRAFLYEKLEYLGFTPQVIVPETDDLSFKKKLFCFACNFMTYCDTGDERVLSNYEGRI